jgi:hypothetical protein
MYPPCCTPLSAGFGGGSMYKLAAEAKAKEEAAARVAADMEVRCHV